VSAQSGASQGGSREMGGSHGGSGLLACNEGHLGGCDPVTHHPLSPLGERVGLRWVIDAAREGVSGSVRAYE